MKENNSTCVKCGCRFAMGRTGIGYPEEMCDSCAGIERDKFNDTWRKGQETQDFFHIETGEKFTVNRRDVF